MVDDLFGNFIESIEKRKNALPVVRDLYDEIWVYGLPQICNPLEEIDLPQSVHRKTVYTGYLPPVDEGATRPSSHEPPIDGPYLLVTAGGGGGRRRSR